MSSPRVRSSSPRGRKKKEKERKKGRKKGRKEEREVALDHVAGKVGGANFPYLASLAGCSIGIIEVYLVPRLRFPPTQPSRSSPVSVQLYRLTRADSTGPRAQGLLRFVLAAISPSSYFLDGS